MQQLYHASYTMPPSPITLFWVQDLTTHFPKWTSVKRKRKPSSVTIWLSWALCSSPAILTYQQTKEMFCLLQSYPFKSSWEEMCLSQEKKCLGNFIFHLRRLETCLGLLQQNEKRCNWWFTNVQCCAARKLSEITFISWQATVQKYISNTYKYSGMTI